MENGRSIANILLLDKAIRNSEMDNQPTPAGPVMKFGDWCAFVGSLWRNRTDFRDQTLSLAPADSNLLSPRLRRDSESAQCTVRVHSIISLTVTQSQ
jgi:hypothetical protein